MIYIGRARTILGTFTEEEARAGLVSGRFSLTDLGWKEGMENWAPLSQFPELAAPPTPMPPLPGSEEATPPPYRPETEPHTGLPWENREGRGAAISFLVTARMVLVSPREAFARMLTEGRLAVALVYNMIGGWIGVIAAGMYAVAAAKIEAPPKPGSPLAAFYQTPAATEAGLRTFCIMGPVIVTLMALGAALVAHLCLMLTGGANKRFHVTLRVFCYSFGSALLLELFPFFGGPMALVWMLVCSTIGLRVAHETTTGRAVATMVLFAAGCVAGFLGLALLAVAAGGMGN